LVGGQLAGRAEDRLRRETGLQNRLHRQIHEPVYVLAGGDRPPRTLIASATGRLPVGGGCPTAPELPDGFANLIVGRNRQAHASASRMRMSVSAIP
jgi:hypothetical protein